MSSDSLPEAAAALRSRGADDEEAQDEPLPLDDSDSAATASDDAAIPKSAPVIPLHGRVIFPGMVVPVPVRGERGARIVDDVLPSRRDLVLTAISNPEAEDPGPDDLHRVGVLARVLRMVRPTEDDVVLIVQSQRRIRIDEFTQTDPFLEAAISPVEESAPPSADDKHWQAGVRNLRETAAQLVDLNPAVPDEAKITLANIEDPGILTDVIAGNLGIDNPQKQALLEEGSVAKRLGLLQRILNDQLEIAQLQQKLRKDVESTFSDSQRRAYLREQIRAIQRELGEGDGAEEQAEELQGRLDEAGLPEEVLKEARRELKRIDAIPAASPEYSVIVSYLETLAELPWNRLSEDNLDLEEARSILDRDHHDLDKVKRRLIEFLAVRKLNPEGHGPILCLLGPPGVGKTSLGQSIADALGRKFARISLGGMRDEAEIRGHRRTYIGSMPGRLIQELRRCGTRNPVFMLDEIDKVGADFRGDPASALLEVLDPAQNHAFMDRYLDVPFDLSQVIFIATANYIDPVPGPLKDRMEVIHIPGYSDADKLAIAREYIVERQRKANGLMPAQFSLPDDTIRRVIDDYTREAGVRNLERQVGAVLRWVASKVAAGDTERIDITADRLEDALGPAQFVRDTKLRESIPGVVTGLAYTPVGGEVLHIEALRYPGSGKVKLTGQIGDVMKESVHIAASLARARTADLGIEEDDFNKYDLHVHVPAGAIPKDGPSAGIAMFTAIASLYADKPVRADTAMTGEVTLRGLVLPIGGLKEKLLAAVRAGITRVIIPKLNEKDIPDIDAEIRAKLDIIPAEKIDTVLAEAINAPAERK